MSMRSTSGTHIQSLIPVVAQHAAVADAASRPQDRGFFER